MGCACRHELPCTPSNGWRLPAQHVTGQCHVFFHPRAASTVGGSMPTVQTPSGRNRAPPGLEPHCVLQGALVSCAHSRATPPAPRVPAPRAVQTLSCRGCSRPPSLRLSPLPGLCRLSHAGPAPTHMPVVSPRSQGLAQPGTVAFPPALAPVPSGWEDHLPLLPVASCQNCHFKVKDPCVLGIKLLIHFLQDLGSDFLPPPDWTQPLSF